MSKADFTARNGKQVCIKEETHERIMKFVNVVGKGQATVASFIDNIINEHFAIHVAEIKAALMRDSRHIASNNNFKVHQ